MTICQTSDGMEAEVSLDRQKSIIAEALNASMHKGETWYLLDTSWFKQWQKYVGYNASCLQYKAIPTEHPGPVDNSALLSYEDDCQDLKQGLYCDVDYALLSTEGWTHLISWYGIIDGQYPIDRKVVEHGLYAKDVKVEVYLTSLSLCLNSDPDTIIKKKFSKAAALGDLVVEMKTLFHVPEEEDTRLWSRYMNNTYELLKNMDSTVETAGLYSGQILLLEQKRDDGTWSRQTRTRSISGSTSSACSVENVATYPASGYSSYSAFAGDYRTRSNSVVRSGLCGLSNLGNTCFMNSGVQCLSNTISLTKFFLADNYKAELNHTNPLGTGGRIANAYADLLKQMWSGQNNYVVPRDFKMQVGRFVPQMSGYQQQDSHELLAFLLDGLHEDLNRVKKKPYIEMPDAGDRPDDVVAAEAWRNHLLRNDSVIVDLFHGLFKSTVVCPECDKVSVKFDPFCYLTLPLPARNERSLKVTFIPLDATKRPTMMQVKCPKSGTIDHLTRAVANLTGLPSDKLVVADVFSHRFHKIYKKHKSLSYIEDRDTTIVYEIPISMADYEASELLLLPVYHRSVQKQANLSYGTSTTLFGLPMLVPIPRQNITYQDLYGLLCKRMRRFLRDDIKQVQETNSSDLDELAQSPAIDSQDENQSIEESSMDVDTPDNSSESSDGAGLFTIQSVNSFGNAVLGTFVDDGASLELNNHSYLALDWSSDKMDRVYNKEEAELFDHHPTLNQEPSHKRAIQLADCLDLFLTKERLGAEDPWYCPSCKKHQQASKKFDLWSLPKVVVIHLKRFSYARFWRDKLDSLVEFPTRGLDLSKFVSNVSHPPAVYDLHAVSNHYGGLGGGHYTAYAKNAHDGQWYYFDDTSVTVADEGQVVSKAAYLLFYMRRDDPSHEAAVANDLLSDDESLLRQSLALSSDEEDTERIQSTG